MVSANKLNPLLLTLSVGLIFLFQNCGPADSGSKQVNSQSVQDKANFEWINKNIIKPVCVDCHNPSMAFSGLDFTTYSGVIEAVEPGDPQNSIFYTRSFTTKFFTLTNEEREIIRVWISNGALN